MTERGSRPWAYASLVAGGRVAAVVEIGGDAPCDVALVDELLRLCLGARRCGASVRLTGVEPALRELLDLMGVADELGV